MQIGLTFLVPAYPGCPEKEAVKRVSVCLSYMHKTPVKLFQSLKNIRIYRHISRHRNQHVKG